jgi:phage N-6-adenine-methyltransferase
MNRDCWSTPKEVFQALNAEFNFVIDVAASAGNTHCTYWLSEEDDALSRHWLMYSDYIGSYVWCNPPYSDIMPWVKKAAEQSKRNGIGVVMLVMADTSVGWYAEAIKTCQEVRFVIGGRLAFINPETKLPVGGNNKGSMFLIWHPFAKGDLVVKHVHRSELIGSK